MSAPKQPQAPSAAEISAAMTALGSYAQPPTADELDQQARAVGGEHVLAAILANALYGASIGTGMLTEGYMLDAGAGAKEMSLAREQVLKASGADGPGVIGVLHWQTGHVAQFLKATASRECGPVIAAAARASSALLTLLACSTVTDTADVHAAQIPQDLARAREELAAAVAELDSLPDRAAELFLGGAPRV
ncbi:hypothetical protein M1P56_35610 (plasmid) [Streptomyces sp. HU2014]|uniref:DUF6245 family protein n=1 Tax=Streptomyces sp. HU2014 TaxID=2939414 RepID=UPI00200FA8EA|nr:DUF6245 family protein [Streptomyces sp. HU2014]UQI49819.1 hypothetical protein M1P56_35610 [Streptomyces sp. HU2014]